MSENPAQPWSPTVPAGFGGATGLPPASDESGETGSTLADAAARFGGTTGVSGSAVSFAPSPAGPAVVAAGSADPIPGPLSDDETEILERLKDVVDPELGVNIVDLGLIYGITLTDDRDVTIDMTLTTPACPLTDQLEWGAQTALADITKSVTVNWVWLPPWTLDRITEEGREQLRYIGYNV